MLSEGHHRLVRIGRTLAMALVMCGCAVDADEATALLQTEAVVGMDAGAQDSNVDASDPRAPLMPRPPINDNAPKYPPDWPADAPKVLALRTSGSGCPAGTVAAFVSRDPHLLTIAFSNFEAVKKPGQSIGTKDCQLVLKLQSGDALSYTLENVTGLGYAYLEHGLVGRQNLRAYFQGQRPSAEPAHTDLTAPYDDTFPITYDAPTTSPCGRDRELVVLTTLRIVGEPDAGRSEGYLTLSSVDAAISLGMKIKLRWARCE